MPAFVACNENKAAYRFSKSRIHQRVDEPRLPFLFLSHEFIEFIEFVEFIKLSQGGKPAIGDGVLWTTPYKRGVAEEAQLGAAKVNAVSL